MRKSLPVPLLAGLAGAMLSCASAQSASPSSDGARSSGSETILSLELLLAAGSSVAVIGILGFILFALKKPKAPPPDLSKYEARNPAGTRFGPPATWDSSPPREETVQEMPPELKEWMRRNQPPKRE